jgi:riboflavin-specific deaminase-like protein
MANGRRGLPDGQARRADGGSWDAIPQTFRSPESPLPQPWQDIFGPVRGGLIDELVVIGQCGQSIDARVATASGDSHYINGEAGLDHLHRLRALVDAVVIGVGTAVADDPQLTVRRVSGPDPARVIVDPHGRLPQTARVLKANGARRIVVTAADCARQLPAGVEVIALARENDQLAPAAIIRELAERGFRRILIEGGTQTLSRFLGARCLDRLHILVAPILLGGGRPSISLPPLQRIGDAARLAMRAFSLDACAPAGASLDAHTDVLLDCDLSPQRIPIGRAKMSR